MAKFWLYGCATNDYMDHRSDVDLINVFDTYEIAVKDAQWRYSKPQDSTYWINYARILEVENNLPVREWWTPDQPIDDGLLPTLEFSPATEYSLPFQRPIGVVGIPDYWND